MAAVHILILGEMAGFKIVPFINTHKNGKKNCSWSYGKNFSANQNSPVCMKTTDIKLYPNKIKYDITLPIRIKSNNQCELYRHLL